MSFMFFFKSSWAMLGHFLAKINKHFFIFYIGVLFFCYFANKTWNVAAAFVAKSSWGWYAVGSDLGLPILTTWCGKNRAERLCSFAK